MKNCGRKLQIVLTFTLVLCMLILSVSCGQDLHDNKNPSTSVSEETNSFETNSKSADETEVKEDERTSEIIKDNETDILTEESKSDIEENTSEKTTDYAVIDPTIIVSDVTVSGGEKTTEVLITVKNNPGISGAVLNFSYSNKLTLKAITAGEAWKSLTMTQPGKLSNPFNVSWDSEKGEEKADGIILKLTFEISSNVKSGDVLDIYCTYNNGDIFDESLNDVVLSIKNGSITIK